MNHLQGAKAKQLSPPRGRSPGSCQAGVTGPKYKKMINKAGKQGLCLKNKNSMLRTMPIPKLSHWVTDLLTPKLY